MDAVNYNISPEICRCCLVANGNYDLLESYINEMGENEIYCDILKNCFGINLSLLREWGCSHHICDLCLEQLKDANRFKAQVLRAEENFILLNQNRKDEGDIKMETEFYTKDPELSTDTYDEDNTETISNNMLIKNKTINNLNDEELEFVNEPAIEESCHYIQTKDTCTQKNLTKKIKQISERKRIRLTCDVILKNTTACPFRHFKSWFQCFFCTQEFMEINLIRNHITNTHPKMEEEFQKIKRFPRSLQIDISVLKCQICDIDISDVDTLCLHFSKLHNKIIYKECVADYKINSSPYMCHLCNKQFHVFRTLTTHLNEHYANCICDVCGKSFINSKRLKVHKRTHEKGNFPCSECGKILKTKSSIANHMQSAHSKHIIKCQICFKPMKHYNDRVKHMSEVHNITHKFKCPICSREYNIKHYLATHIRQTHGHKNKKCHECGMGFITNHSLKKHLQKHSGVKEFSCDVCSKSYARSYTLKEHMRGHEVEKRFSE